MSRRETRSIFSTGSSRRGSRPASIGPLQSRAPLAPAAPANNVAVAAAGELAPAAADRDSHSALRVRAESETLQELDLQPSDPVDAHEMFQSGPTSAALSLNGTPFRQGSRSHRESPLREFSLVEDISIAKSSYDFSNATSNNANNNNANNNNEEHNELQASTTQTESAAEGSAAAPPGVCSSSSRKEESSGNDASGGTTSNKPLVAVRREKVSSLVRAFEASAAAKILGVSDAQLTARMQRMQRQLERRRWYNIYRGLLRFAPDS